jgi:hypothetical protein
VEAAPVERPVTTRWVTSLQSAGIWLMRLSSGTTSLLEGTVTEVGVGSSTPKSRTTPSQMGAGWALGAASGAEFSVALSAIGGVGRSGGPIGSDGAEGAASPPQPTTAGATTAKMEKAIEAKRMSFLLRTTGYGSGARLGSRKVIGRARQLQRRRIHWKVTSALG